MFNALLDCLRNVLPVLLEKEAGLPRMRLVGLLLLGMKEKSSLPNCLQRLPSAEGGSFFE